MELDLELKIFNKELQENTTFSYIVSADQMLQIAE